MIKVLCDVKDCVFNVDGKCIGNTLHIRSNGSCVDVNFYEVKEHE